VICDLNINTSLLCSLRSGGNDQLSGLNMSDTPLVSWYRLQGYLAIRLWTMSVFAIKSEVWGPYNEQEYSSFERKGAWYMPGFLCSGYMIFFFRKVYMCKRGNRKI